MVTRLCTVMTVATLVCLSSGCSGMRNFLFGRGARCGLCSRLGSNLPTPRFGNTMQAPLAAPSCQAPGYAPAPAYAPQATYAPAPGCGCNQYAGNNNVPESYASGMCGTCGDSYVGGGCGCESNLHYGSADYGINGYDMGTVDPYSNGASLGTLVPGQQYNGETVIDAQPIPQGGVPVQSYPSSPNVSDGNWQARKFDSDGNKILWEEPLPSGTPAL